MGVGASRPELQKAVLQISEKSLPDSDAFWNAPAGFLAGGDINNDNIYQIVRPADVRQIRERVPENLRTFLRKSVEVLERSDEKNVALPNAVRLLTRVLPFMFEVEDLEEEFFWREEAETAAVSVPRHTALGYRLVNALMQVAFLPGYTIPASAQVHLPEGYLWAAGIGAAKVQYPSAAMLNRRAEVLKLLLVCCSKNLYLSPDQLLDPKTPNKWLEAATSPGCPNTDKLLRSMLNTIVSYDPVGWGVPFNSVFADPPEACFNTAAQLVAALLDYKASPELLPEPLAAVPNAYRRELAAVSDPADLEALLQALRRLLNNVWQAKNTYLPGSMKGIQCYPELLVLLWHCLDANKEFLGHLLRSPHAMEIAVPCVYFLVDSRRDPARIGVVHIAIFTLLLLSGEREFCVALNRPCATRLPTDLPLFAGTHGDLVVLAIHKAITNGLDRLQSLYSCMLTVLCNISPYLKSLSFASATKLIHLLEVFSLPRMLFSSEGAHNYAFLLLETFNNLIQYQYEGSAHLVTAVLRQRETFDRLAAVSLPAPGSAPAPGSDPGAAAAAAAAAAPAAQPSSEHHNDAAEHAPVPDSEASPSETHSTLPTLRRPPVSSSSSSSILGAGAGAGPSGAAAAGHPAAAPAPKQPPAFVPTEEWLNEWKQRMPLGTILRLVAGLLPQVESFTAAKEKEGVTVDEAMIIDFVKNTTMVGLLPVPHPILMRKYQGNHYTAVWFTTFIWGIVYIRNQFPPLFDGSHIKLFSITYVRA